MLISDWSSDVCSSDLRVVVAGLADDGAGAIARLQDRRGVPVTRLGDIRRRAVRQLVDVGGVVVAILADSRVIAVAGLVDIREAVAGLDRKSTRLNSSH